jgi:hypothetical protein
MFTIISFISPSDINSAKEASWMNVQHFASRFEELKSQKMLKGNKKRRV